MTFTGEKSVLSNLAEWDVQIEYDDDQIQCRSSEMAYHWLKLTFLELHDEANQLLFMANPTGRNVMRRARTLLNRALQSDRLDRELLENWRLDGIAETVLRELCILKIRKYPEFRDILAENCDKAFIELTSNPYWGTGLPSGVLRTCSEQDLLNCPGMNKMGRILSDMSSIARHYVNSGQLPVPRGFMEIFGLV